jgi:hypothetical protein
MDFSHTTNELQEFQVLEQFHSDITNYAQFLIYSMLWLLVEDSCRNPWVAKYSSGWPQLWSPMTRHCWTADYQQSEQDDSCVQIYSRNRPADQFIQFYPHGIVMNWVHEDIRKPHTNGSCISGMRWGNIGIFAGWTRVPAGLVWSVEKNRPMRMTRKAREYKCKVIDHI